MKRAGLVRWGALGLLVTASWCFWGCGGRDVPAYDLDYELGGCGMEPYDWLGPEQVGRLLESDEDSVLSPMSAESIDGMLKGTELEPLSPVAHGGRVFYIRYATQDRGQAVEATAMVAFPWDEDGSAKGPFPLVLWLHGTSGFIGECAPSNSGAEQVLGMLLLASRGYVVVAPDYIGLDPEDTKPPQVYHAYLNIEQTAVGSLDAARAGLTLLADLEDAPYVADRMVVWGGSQGGHAAFSVDLVQPYYAPEFTIEAVVAMVPPTDLLGLTQYAVSSPNPATVALAAVLTAQRHWYGGTQPMTDVFSDAAPWNVASNLEQVMYTTCDAGNQFDGIEDVTDIYQVPFVEKVEAGSWDELQPWSCYLRLNSIGSAPMARRNDAPVLFILGDSDTLVETSVERRDFDALCAKGWPLQYLECQGATHTRAAVWSLPEQFDWVEARLAGDSIPAGDLCHRSAPVRCSGMPEQ